MKKEKGKGKDREEWGRKMNDQESSSNFLHKQVSHKKREKEVNPHPSSTCSGSACRFALPAQRASPRVLSLSLSSTHLCCFLQFCPSNSTVFLLLLLLLIIIIISSSYLCCFLPFCPSSSRSPQQNLGREEMTRKVLLMTMMRMKGEDDDLTSDHRCFFCFCFVLDRDEDWNFHFDFDSDCESDLLCERKTRKRKRNDDFDDDGTRMRMRMHVCLYLAHCYDKSGEEEHAL